MRHTLSITLFAAVMSSLAIAQTNEFRLGESGAWMQQGERVASDGDEAMIFDARAALAEDDPELALELMEDLLDSAFPIRDDLLAEALLLRGDAKLALGREFRALYDYEELIREFPRSPQFVTAVEREFEIAVQYLNGLRRRFLGMRLVSGEDAGIELLIRVQERVPGSQLADRANITLADHFFDRREIALAADAYRAYIANCPEGEHRQHAERRLIYADLARFKGPRYDASVLLDAGVLAEDYTERYPLSASAENIDEGLAIRIDESLAAQLLESAEWYLLRDNEPSARYVLSRLFERHPDSLAAEAARGLIAQRGWTEDEMIPVGVRDRAERETSSADRQDAVLIEGQLEGRVEQVPTPTQDRPSQGGRQ